MELGHGDQGVHMCDLEARDSVGWKRMGGPGVTMSGEGTLRHLRYST